LLGRASVVRALTLCKHSAHMQIDRRKVHLFPREPETRLAHGDLG